MTFPEFLQAWRDGKLDKDAAWRAYDFERAALPRHTRSALKKLGLAYAGELALPEFCARYGVAGDVAPMLLGAWWLWSLVDAGRQHRVPLRSGGAGKAA